MFNSQSSQNTSGSKRARRANITPDEEVALCSAFVKITLDASVGADQTSNTFWGRVNAVYNSFEGVGALSDKTLAKKFGIIQKSVSAFVGYITRVPRASGSTPVDWIARARQDYLRVEKKPFPYDHVFQIFQELPKFNPNHTENQSLEGIEGTATNATPRPLYGRKAEKERQRGNTSKRRVEEAREVISKTDDFMTLIKENRVEKKQQRERIEQEMREMTRIQRLQTDINLREYNASMIYRDTSHMNPMQLEYHQQELARILSGNQVVSPTPLSAAMPMPSTSNAPGASRGKAVDVHRDEDDESSSSSSSDDDDNMMYTFPY